MPSTAGERIILTGSICPWSWPAREREVSPITSDGCMARLWWNDPMHQRIPLAELLVLLAIVIVAFGITRLRPR